MVTKIENILSQVADIVQQDREQRAEQEKNGKGFNLFDALRLKESEKIHSAFIAELLNPNGQHGFRDTFLRAFISSVDCLRDWEFNTNSAKIETEYRIGPINQKYTQGGVIDILIQSENKAIIIENKINAPDQCKQLIRYKNHVKTLVKSKDDYRIIYLTVDGAEASEYSTKNQMESGKDYHTIGYSTEILEWLKTCESESANNLMVCNAITQYLNTVKDIIKQDMFPENSDKIVEIMSRPENVEAVLAIHNHINDWTHKIVEKYLIPQLRDWAENNNLNFNQLDDFGFYFYRNEWMRSAIWIYTENQKRWKDFYIGISSKDGKSLKGYTNKYQIFEKPNIWWPYGRKYLDEYNTWYTETMIDIVEGKVAEYIIERVKEVLDKIDQLGVEMP